jgi:hypothetical protein
MGELESPSFDEKSDLAEAFNFLNRANFNLPGSFNVFSRTTISPVVGVILATANSSRQLQLGLKAIF